MLTFGSLFAGIGGLDLGLERAGFQCRWQVEIDPYCQAVLLEHWPHVPKFADIRRLSGGELGPVDLIAGGFPCQPFSNAGKRRGVDDERWLWPEFARIVRLLRPRYVFVENVPGLLAGRGMADVLGDLAALGFDAEWECIPAAAVGAPHLRWRVFIVAYLRESSGAVPDASGRELRIERQRNGQQHREPRPSVVGANGLPEPLADADEPGLERRRVLSERSGQQPARPRSLADAEEFAERARLRTAFARREWRRRFGDGGRWEPEPNVGRVAHGVPSRVDRLRALGNAVVPQVAEAIGRMILEFDQ